MGTSKTMKPDSAYRLMVWEFRIRDALGRPDGILKELGIRKGFAVADIGCGPGRYIQSASGLVGENGIVYAVDPHPLALQYVEKRIQKHRLGNVVPLLNTDGNIPIADGVLDAAYGLDMFHLVDDAEGFLAEMYRVMKQDGWLVLEDGHQTRERTKEKIGQSSLWRIEAENGRYVKLAPAKRGE